LRDVARLEEELWCRQALQSVPSRRAVLGSCSRYKKEEVLLMLFYRELSAAQNMGLSRLEL